MDDARLICGAMSGTSADGVDAALVRIEGRGLGMTATPVAHAHVPFEPALRSQVLDVRGRGEVRLADLASIGRRVTLAHVDACRAVFAKANVTARDVAAIAAHGQTLWHGPPDTIQYFDPSLLAVETGCAVVSDFRRADLAVGGQGAPLVPFADYILFRHPTRHRAVLNLGGIANITALFAGGSPEQIVAFDIGPANCLSDHILRMRRPDGETIDAGGRLALRGTVVREIFDAMGADPYFVKLGTKSTDGPAMVAIYEAARARLAGPVPLEDELATAAAFVAHQVLRSLSIFGRQFDGDLIVGGGGVHNAAVMTRLGAWRSTDDFGIAADAREAIAFALLGAATLDGEPSNVPSATGASRRVVLGSITPRN